MAEHKMKILFLTELTHAGGVDTFLRTLLEHWPDHGDELYVMTNASHPGLSALVARLKGRARVSSHGISSYVDYVIRRESRRQRRNPVFAFLQRLVLALWGFFAFRRLFQQVAPDRLVVVAGGYPGGDSCRIAALAWKSVAADRPKAIYNVHNLASRTSGWGFLESTIDALVARSVSAFVAVSQACAESMRYRPQLWKAVPIGFILNGIVSPPQEEGELPVRAELGIAPHCPLVLMLATYERRKGHDLLLDAFAQTYLEIPAARLVICGFGYENEVRYVEQGVAARGLASVVTLMGFRRDVYRILAAADILAVPTQAYESFGLVAAEAMSLGVPVIATRVGGLPEVVSHDHGGYLVEPDDVQGFASYLIQLLTEEALRKRQGQLGRERYLQHFTASRMAQQYASCIALGMLEKCNSSPFVHH
jgi:glycosyltransferase involved in cell wall biosynthesis